MHRGWWWNFLQRLKRVEASCESHSYTFFCFWIGSFISMAARALGSLAAVELERCTFRFAFFFHFERNLASDYDCGFAFCCQQFNEEVWLNQQAKKCCERLFTSPMKFLNLNLKQNAQNQRSNGGSRSDKETRNVRVHRCTLLSPQ